MNPIIPDIDAEAQRVFYAIATGANHHKIADAILAERNRCITIAQSLRGPSAELIAEQIAAGVQKERA